MKNVLYFIPAILYTFLLAYAFNTSSVEVPAYILLVLLWSAGGLLAANIFWGGLLGFLPAFGSLYSSTLGGKFATAERNVGIVLIIYYLICMLLVIYDKKKQKSKTNQV